MILIRRLLGDVLRRKRQDEGRTLRQLAAEARISPGYLSEIERGQKEPSSELLSAICDALDVRLSELLREVSIDLAAAELAAQLEAERVGVALAAGKSVPGARLGTTPVVKSVPLGKAVVRAGARPGGRPAPRPVTRRVPPVAAGAGSLPPGVLTQSLLDGGRLSEVPLGALGPVTSVGLPGENDRLVMIPLVNLGDLALR